MTNSGPRRTTIQIVWQIFVGCLLGLFAVQLLGIFLVRFAYLARGQMNLQHLVEFSMRERLFLISLPTFAAALLVRKRPFVALGMLLSAAVGLADVGRLRAAGKQIVFAFSSPLCYFAPRVFNRCLA
jgi:hypothetical protein